MASEQREGAGASPVATGLAGADAPEPPSRLGPSDGIPSAAADRILLAVKRALANLDDPLMNWQEYHRRLRRTPDLVLRELREAQVLFRLPEQADWPLLIEAFSQRPYTLTIRTQMTIGGQTFGYDQQTDDRMLYVVRNDRYLAAQMGKRAIRATLEAVAEPYFTEAAHQFVSAIEARRAETLGSARESAVAKPDTQPSPEQS